MNKPGRFLATLVLPAIFAWCGNLSGQAENPKSAPPAARLWITVIQDGHPVTDLKKEELELWVGKHEQSILTLGFNPREPLKVGLLVDLSGSRRSNWPGPEIALGRQFLRQAILPGDQGFIVDFSDQPFIDADVTSDLSFLDSALDRLAGGQPRGGTALYDAIKMACEQEEIGETTHRALVIITDGEDNASRATIDEAMAAARRTGTQLYVIGTFEDRSRLKNLPNSKTRRAPGRLLALALITGGMLFMAGNDSEKETAFSAIAETLHAQYALDFQPLGLPPAGKGNRITFKCSRPHVEIVAPRDY